MEGRDPPVAAEANYDPPSSPPPPYRHPHQLSSDTKDTYIVQIPRDQIYRFPPPANARIVESYRSPNPKKKSCGGKCCLWVIVTLFALAAIVGIGVAIIHVFYNPKTPEFSVTKVVVKNTTTSHTKHAHLTYEIFLKVYNSNERTRVSYQDGGETSLSFEHKEIGRGKYTSFSQEAKNSTTVHVTIAGSNGALPVKIEKSIKDPKSKTPVALSLTIDVPVKINTFIPRSQELTVNCDFKVSTLGSGTEILSEKCDS